MGGKPPLGGAILVKILSALILSGAAAASSPAFAQEQPGAPPPAVFSRVTDCRTIQDNAQRLACFDREVAALAQAQAAREVVVVDREAVQRTRRSLFGLTLPDVGRLFGDDQQNEINSTVVAAQVSNLGMASVQIEGGAVWVQTEGRPISRRPRPGMPVQVRRGALGSYLLSVDGQRAVRVIRQR
jgi:hypothetical protein